MMTIQLKIYKCSSGIGFFTGFPTKEIENFEEIFLSMGICHASLMILFFFLGIFTYVYSQEIAVNPKKDPASTKLEQRWELHNTDAMSFVHLEKASQAWHEVIRRSIWPRELWIRPRLSMLQSEALGQTNSSWPGLSSAGPTRCKCWPCSEAALCTNHAPSVLNLSHTAEPRQGGAFTKEYRQQPHKNQEKQMGHMDLPYGEALAHVHIVKNNLHPWVQDTLFQCTPSSRNSHPKAEDASPLCHRKFRAQKWQQNLRFV